MEDRKISEKESLELIAQMIRNTQNKLAAGSGRPLLLFGYASVLFSLGIWVLVRATGQWQWNYLWLLLPFICWPGAVFLYRRMRDATTYIDRILKYICILTGITINIACFLSLAIIDLQSLFFSGLLLGMATCLTGLVVRLTSVTVSGAIGLALSPLLLWMNDVDKLLIFAVVFIFVFVVPGHALNQKSKTDR